MNGDSDSATRLWVHDDPHSTRMWEFKTLIEKKYNVQFEDYEALRQWSIQNVNDFWTEIWHFTGIRSSQPFTKAVEDEDVMFPRPAFFPGAKLNFAENLLYPQCDPPEDSLAVIGATEVSREEVTWKQLRERVKQCTKALRGHGVVESDRVAGYLANHTNTLVAMLAATSIGAIWTGVSPDTGVHAVLDRLKQIQPKVLFADNAVLYNGKIHEVHEKLASIAAALPTLSAVAVFDTVPDHPTSISKLKVANGKAYSYADFLSTVDLSSQSEQTFTQLPPDHPVYILYSSGTTGKPKCIVHGAIGTLIQHKKEHDIQCDIRPGARLFYFTTCTWMMWHWLVSGLASGATLILYDGSPFRPLLPTNAADPSSSSSSGDLAMPRLISSLRITHFGTSAKYLSMLEQKNVLPANSPDIDLSSLRAIYSTGSPLAPSTFHYVYRAFPSHINLASITGGTDIVSLFGAPCPLLPVYAGEIQCRGLGMAVETWDASGGGGSADISATGAAGDLVCTRPFPCQPVHFWGDDASHSTYRASYFATAFRPSSGAPVWHHGDFIQLSPATGGLRMLGRSDGVLKPGGVRFGSAEIYNVLLAQFGAEVEDALCVGRRRAGEPDESVVLFLKMAPGRACDEGLVSRVKASVREALSARHVPALVAECPEIPVTGNGKKVEGAVKQILCGLDIKTGASVANSECLEWYREWSERN